MDVGSMKIATPSVESLEEAGSRTVVWTSDLARLAVESSNLSQVAATSHLTIFGGVVDVTLQLGHQKHVGN